MTAMFPDSGFAIVPEAFGFSLRLSCPLTAALLDELQGSNRPITDVRALWYDSVGDLTQLERLPHLEKLLIINRTLADLTPINRLTRLRALTLESNSIFDVDLRAWPLIEELSVTWHRKFSGLSAAPNLTDFRIWSWKDRDLQRLSEAPQLRSLEIIGGSLRTLSGIEHCKKLEKLSLAYVSKVEDFEALSRLGSLHSLEIWACKRFNQVEPIAHLRSLRTLRLDNTGAIESLAPLRANRRLRTLTFIGSTNILDGNTAILNEMRIEDFGFKNRQHYNYNYDHTVSQAELNLTRLAADRSSHN